MNDNSIYKEFTPTNNTLKKYIKLYYIHYSDDPDYHQKITYYPNYTTSLNMYKDSKVTWNDVTRTHSYFKTNEICKLLVAKFDVSREIIMKGKFNKITIVISHRDCHRNDVSVTRNNSSRCRRLSE